MRLRSLSTKRKAIALAAVAFVLFALYGVVRIVLMGVSLQSTYSDLAKIQASAKQGEVAAVTAGLNSAVANSTAAASAANDPLVQAWNWVPWLGSDLQALEVVSRNGHAMLQSGQQVFTYLNAIKGEGGLHVDPARVESLNDSMSALALAIDKANTEFAGIDAAALHFGLSEKVAKAQVLISKTNAAMKVAEPMVQIGSALLSQTGERHWFIATQNLAEARAVGGITGAYAIVTVKDGHIKLGRFGSDVELLKFGGIDYSSYPEELRDLWGVDLADWRDINASANVPYAGQLIYDGWLQHTGQKLDGVVFVGQGTVAHLAAAGGTISVRDNVLNKDNIVEFLTKGIYAKYPSVPTKNKVVTEVMQQLFANLTSKPLDAANFFASISNDKTGDRLTAWAADKTVQKKLVSAGAAGQVSEKLGPTVQVTVNNAGGNKLEAYANLEIEYALGACDQMTWEGYYARESSLKVKVSNNAPKSGLPAYVTPRLDENFTGEPRVKGSNRELISVYAPVGANELEFTIDGEPAFPSVGVDRSHPVWVFDLELLPGQSRVIEIKLLEPIADLDGLLLKGKPRLIAPVLLNPAKVSVKSGAVCSVKP